MHVSHTAQMPHAAAHFVAGKDQLTAGFGVLASSR